MWETEISLYVSVVGTQMYEMEQHNEHSSNLDSLGTSVGLETRFGSGRYFSVVRFGITITIADDVITITLFRARHILQFRHFRAAVHAPTERLRPNKAQDDRQHLTSQATSKRCPLSIELWWEEFLCNIRHSTSSAYRQRVKRSEYHDGGKLFEESAHRI